MGTHTHVRVHTAILFPPFRINPNHDITRWCNGRLGGRKTPRDFSEVQETSHRMFYTVGEFTFCGGGSSCGGMQIFSLPLVYNENYIVRQEYLCSYPGDRQPGSIHRDVNIVITHKPHGHKGESVKKSLTGCYWTMSHD